MGGDIYWKAEVVKMEQPLLVQLEYLLRLVAAALCGVLIGYERESRLKTAGVRTHMVVALAAALMMLVSKYGFEDLLGREEIGLDPSRIAAGVVTAIGFLGAGVIFVRKRNIVGITTAAGIWATVGVGTAVGAGLYLIGGAATGLLLLLQFFFHRNSRLTRERPGGQITLEVAETAELGALLETLFADSEIEITALQLRRIPESSLFLKLTVRYPERYELADVLRLLHDTPCVRSVRL